jgi:plastocyanin
MLKRIRYEMHIVTAVAIGISYFLFLVFVTPFMDNRQQTQSQPAVSTVVFVEDASNPYRPDHGIDPNTITVIIGVNNTVRWVNQDTIPHGIPTPDDGETDPYFFKAVQMQKENNAFLMPGESFQYTFTVPGQIQYHMAPHPQMRGTVAVLHALPTS